MFNILPALYGYRMCPDCPHCVESAYPCMDVFGSSATPMGGSAGRCDAAVGAVEAQKAEGVLHAHLFFFPQMAHQFCNLEEIAEKLRNASLTVDAMKSYVTNVRRASYPDPEQFQAERERIESAWPAYTTEVSLSKPPRCALTSYGLCPATSPQLLSEAWLKEGEMWKNEYDKRL